MFQNSYTIKGEKMEKATFDINPYTFTGSAILIGLLLTKELSIEEQGSVGNWLQLVGLTIQTYSSQVTTLQSYQTNIDNSNTNSTSDIESLKKAIQKIQEQLNNL